MTNNHSFCQALARSSRADCISKGIHVGKVSTYRSSSSPNTVQFEIWQDGSNKHGWITAHCSAEAKFKFYCYLLTKAAQGNLDYLKEAE